jgi:hypothetical protein
MADYDKENDLWYILLKIKDLERNSVDKLDLYLREAKTRNYDEFSIYFYAVEIGGAERVFEYFELVRCIWEYSELMWEGSLDLQIAMFDERMTEMEWYRKERFTNKNESK